MPKFSEIAPAGANLAAADFLLAVQGGTLDRLFTTAEVFAYANLYVEGPDRLSLIDGTTPQTFRTYNTYSAAGANFERATLDWVSNVFKLGIEASGTGTLRDLVLASGNVDRLRLVAGTGTGGGAGAIILHDDHAETLDGTYAVLQLTAITTGSGEFGLKTFGVGNNQYGSASAQAKTRGTAINDYTIVQSGDRLLDLGGYGADGTGYVFGAGLLFTVDGTPGVGSMPTKMMIRTPNDAFSVNSVAFANVLGSLGRQSPNTKAADFTVGTNDNWLINNKGSTCVVTLPSAASFPGREIMFLNYAAQALNSVASNVIPLAGGSAGTAILAATAGKWAVLVSNGANWMIMLAN